jgi:hypothetical protein
MIVHSFLSDGWHLGKSGNLEGHARLTDHDIRNLDFQLSYLEAPWKWGFPNKFIRKFQSVEIQSKLLQCSSCPYVSKMTW